MSPEKETTLEDISERILTVSESIKQRVDLRFDAVCSDLKAIKEVLAKFERELRQHSEDIIRLKSSDDRYEKDILYLERIQRESIDSFYAAFREYQKEQKEELSSRLSSMENRTREMIDSENGKQNLRMIYVAASAGVALISLGLSLAKFFGGQ
jgi:hypothetical protein